MILSSFSMQFLSLLPKKFQIILLGTSDAEVAQQPELFDFDHLYLAMNVSSPVAILYGALGTGCFKDFHLSLAEAAQKVCSVSYATLIVQQASLNMVLKCYAVVFILQIC